MKKYYLRAMVSVYITVEAEDMTYERAEELMDAATTCLELNFEEFKPEGTVGGSIGSAYDVEFDDETEGEE